MTTPGLIGQWRQGTLAVRSLAHIAAAVESSKGRNRWVRGVALAGSLTADVALARRAGTARRNRGVEAVVNVVDGACWAYLARGAPEFVRTAVVATLVPTGIGSGFRLGAGTDAVPVVEPSRPWSPAWNPPLPRLFDVVSRGRRRVVPREASAKRPGSTDTVLACPKRVVGRGDPVEGSGHEDVRNRFDDDSVGRRRRPQWPRMGEIAGTIATDLLPPLAAVAAVRRVRRLRTGFGPIGWALFAGSGGYALARTRDDAQRSTVELWRQRTATVIDEARVASQVQSALVHNIAMVDPKSMLRMLADEGSTRCAAALEELGSVPADTFRRFESRGTLLAKAAKRPVEPPEDAARWIDNAAIAKLRQALERIDDDCADREAEAPQDVTITVLSTRGTDMLLRYRRRDVRLEKEMPELAIRLEPALPAAVVGLAWTALCATPSFGQVPTWAVAPAIVLQAQAIRRLAAQPGHLRQLDAGAARLVGASVAALDLAVGLRQRKLRSPGGMSLVPATGATQPLVMLLAANWRDLERERWLLAAVGTLGWAFALRRPGPRPFSVVVCELAFVLMPALATATTGADTRREAGALDAELDRRLAEEVEVAARQIAHGEVDRFRAQVQLVVDELERAGQDLPDKTVGTVLARYRKELERLDPLDPLDVVNW